MKPIISTGNQDFSSIRENNYFYVDKTNFIKEWWENGDIVTLITRPRRFGKTLNMSMVESFFSNQYSGKNNLFKGLSIWKEEKYQKLQGTYPVIFLSFAGIGADTWELSRMGIIRKLVKLYSSFRFVKEYKELCDKDLAFFDSVTETMPDDAAAVSINYLADYLYRHYGKKVIILLDEYDTPMQEAYLHGYWNEMVSFTRSLFNFTFKTNPYLERGLMTGITRISKESIFSDLNNLKIITTTSEKYATSFGFTEQEVFQALAEQGLFAYKNKVKKWYNGFTFGNYTDIYNPWSITNFLDTAKLETYWANTSSNHLAGKLIREGSPEIKTAMEDLLMGKPLITSLDEEIIFNQLEESDTAIWSLLLAFGYLNASESYFQEETGKTIYYLKITNQETLFMFKSMIQSWFSKPAIKYNDFMKALLLNDVKHMNQFMNRIAEETFSSFDIGNQPSEKEPERFYHGLVLGLIADSRLDYRITSNRESGFGRYDVVLKPKNKTDHAYVFEFKVQDSEEEKELQDTANAALAQIKEKNYDADLIARGIPAERIHHYGFAFCGKKVFISGTCQDRKRA